MELNINSSMRSAVSDQDGHIVCSSVLISILLTFSLLISLVIVKFKSLSICRLTRPSALKKQNQELKAQIGVLSDDINNLKMKLRVNAGDDSTSTAAAQIENDQRSPTKEHSDFQSVQTRAEAELKRLSASLAQVRARVDEVGKAIDAMEEYSYEYNIKIVGLPELNAQETAMDTSKLCAKLFAEMGTDITLQDIDIAHRVPLRTEKCLEFSEAHHMQVYKEDSKGNGYGSPEGCL